jgi:hypothetical protein
MLTLTLSGNTIPLPPDFSMQLTWKSPVCAFDKIPGSFGLGISIPINEYTRSLFNFPERFSKSRGMGNQKFPGFEVRFGGVLLMAGTLTISSASETIYEASLIDQVGVLGEKEQERDILDIEAFGKETSWVISQNYTPDHHSHCCFPIINHGFFKDKGIIIKREEDQPDPMRPGKMKTESYEDEVMSYLFNKTTHRTVNFMVGGAVYAYSSTTDLSVLAQKNNSYQKSNVTVVSPFLFLNYVIKEALKDNFIHISSNYLDDDTQLRNLCIYNNYDITTTQYANTGEIIIQDQVLGNDATGMIVWVAQPHSTGYKLYSYIRTYDNKFIARNHLPKMKLGDLILSTQNFANVCFHFLPNNTVAILSREKIVTDPATDLESYFLGVWEIGEQKNVALKFSREHDKEDLIFSERFNDLSDRRGDIKEPVVDWLGLWAIAHPVEGEIRLMTINNTFYEYRWISQEKVNGQTLESDTTDVLGWEEISIGLQNGWYGFGREEVEEIKTSWSSIYGNSQINLVNQQGSMNTWKAKQKDFSPRLMMYHGNNSGGPVNDHFSMEYEKKDTGLLDLYWKNWNLFWANRLEVSGDFDFSVNVLRHVIYNICHKYRTREGEFLIEEMSCELFIDRIGVTQIKGFKV